MEIERVLSGAAESLSVRRCFGQPIEQAGTVVIPVAVVAGGGGGGEGEDGTSSEPRADKQSAERSGRGAGFGGVTWPLGVYVLRDGHVRWVPAVDATRIVLGALALVRAMAKVAAMRRLHVARRAARMAKAS
ncbi:MAG: spore germination protein GerW family protein [Actinomycetota bacterium]|nr:spore germination protein GerW family protein [Actinomycetota bacterium]